MSYPAPLLSDLGKEPVAPETDAQLISRTRKRFRQLVLRLFVMLLVIALAVLLLPPALRHETLIVLCVILVLLGTLPMIASLLQYVAVGWHRRAIGYEQLTAYYPRTAIIIPAWNEAAVIGATVDHLMDMEYPPAHLRVYIVDDASTDDTPAIARQKMQEYDGRVVHLRREIGGQGKAHTLNHGIEHILQDNWAQAVLIIDADVLFDPTALRRMTRHLSNPAIGAVTAYIKEGSRPGNYLTRFIAYEYITAQAIARRAQNIFGALPCLAGGAQLHTRNNLERLGGRIDTSTLAEDTVTTLRTQLQGNRVVFEGNAIVWAEEPPDLVGLWKQRLRWGRGNIQVSTQFSHIWGHPANRTQHVGNWLFTFLWFTILLMPVLMLGTAAGLVGLYFLQVQRAWDLFQMYWIWNAIVYFFVVSMSFAVDPGTARRSWLQGILFPGLISVGIIIFSTAPSFWGSQVEALLLSAGYTVDDRTIAGVTLCIYVWCAGCMLLAYLAKLLSHIRWLRVPAAALLYIAGYGPFLCAVTMASYVKELCNTSNQWDKTTKTGQVAHLR